MLIKCSIKRRYIQLSHPLKRCPVEQPQSKRLKTGDNTGIIIMAFTDRVIILELPLKRAI
jgi:hypothetical protein